MNAQILKEKRISKGLTQEDLAKKIGVTRKTINNYENGGPIPPSKVTLLDLIFNPEVTPPPNEVREKSYTNTLSVRVVTTKARAGFSESYYAEEYLEDLPIVMIDADREHKGNYLAFEVDGDSMEPEYNSGDVVICREVQRNLWQYKLHFKEYDFVIAHGTKGIMLKEITDHNTETGEIVCHSLNQDGGKNKDFTLNLKEVAFLYNVVEHRTSGKSKRRNRL